MSDLIVDPGLLGATVRNPARPEWGDGRVVAIQPVAGSAPPAFRVTVQFHVGRKTMVVPPGRLIAPPDEQRAPAGWIDKLSGNTIDDRLQRLPDDVLRAFGTPRQRLDAVLPWYAFSEAPEDLLRWARKLTGMPDPLTHWSRDELTRAFETFTRERDAHLRSLAGLLRHTGGTEALADWRRSLPAEIADQVALALGRIL